jgi:hypothetical protein
MNWKFPKNSDNDVLLCSTSPSELEAHIKKTGLKPYTPVHQVHQTIPKYDARGDLCGEMSADLYQVQCMMREAT